MRPASIVLALLSLVLFSGAAAAGCGRPGTGAQLDLNGDASAGPIDPLLMNAILRADADGNPLSWESSPWSLPDPMTSEWIPYQPHALIHITHPLGRVPTSVLVYISFVEDGSTPALAAGDLARVVDATTDDVTVWNDTSGTYWCRIVLF